MFYVFPLTAGPTDAMGMVFLIIVATFVLAIIMGSVSKKKAKYVYPLLVSVLFIPSVFIYYNDSALIHSIWYLVISSVGLLIGALMQYFFSRKWNKSQFARERYGERMRILYELSWLWETLVIALAAVCVVGAMLICKAIKKNLSKKTAAVIGAAAFAGAVLAVIVIARTPMPLWLNGMLDCLCISTTF